MSVLQVILRVENWFVSCDHLPLMSMCPKHKYRNPSLPGTHQLLIQVRRQVKHRDGKGGSGRKMETQREREREREREKEKERERERKIKSPVDCG